MGLLFRCSIFVERIKDIVSLSRRNIAETNKLDSSTDLDFLPAHLALLERPANPAARILASLIAAIAICAVLASFLGKLDVIAICNGKLVPTGRTKEIQSATSGVIRAINVVEGQYVKADDVLVFLNDSNVSADTIRIQENLLNSQLAVFRANAMLSMMSGGKIVLDRMRFPSNVSEDEYKATLQLIRNQYQEYISKLQSLKNDSDVKRHELKTLIVQEEKLQQTIPLLETQFLIVQDMQLKQYASTLEMLDKKQNFISARSELEVIRSREGELQDALKKTDIEAEQLQFQLRKELYDSLSKAQHDEIAIKAELSKLAIRKSQTEIKAPISGMVQQISANTIGGTLYAGQVVMRIVPNESLEAEVFVENKDVGFLNVGQQAKVKLEPYPFTRYGYLTGIVKSISADSVADKKNGRGFLVRIPLNQTNIQYRGTALKLSAGMNVTAEILTGKRTVASYFLDPLSDGVGASFGER
ncbi:HlyD family type I secretion periplasmic adaptor subunit [Paucibacter sp. R3-3]|uniref:Membrane fusion protein (MFP) family protein n=1 Tax=Roseateles agri TaxID=3098619 RepID=A0ABU5DDW9_9BURK|nr:HlyD family type I secretion periplasmic adaptor subunit [Paucibacter sp. R3-3]MDY0744001.1 HlyD family type I secretion periplasmic adaptor subunit [Paucibacter sp. R3-3]